MIKNFIYFIKYNNFAVYIFFIIFVLGTGVFAQSDFGQDFIGKESIKQIGVDNSLLLDFDLENFDMNFQIEGIEEDEKYYYVTYTFFDLVLDENAWRYEAQEKIRKISKKSRVDLGEYLADEMKEQYETRIAYLLEKQGEAKNTGESKRKQVKEYGGLIGSTLLVLEKVFPGYDAVKETDLPSPSISATIFPQIKKDYQKESFSSTSTIDAVDEIAEVYNDYLAKKDPDNDGIFGVLDNCPDDFNPDQEDSNVDGIGDVCQDVLTDNQKINFTNNEENKNASSSVATSTLNVDKLKKDKATTTQDNLNNDNSQNQKDQNFVDDEDKEDLSDAEQNAKENNETGSKNDRSSENKETTKNVDNNDNNEDPDVEVVDLDDVDLED